MIGWEDIYKVVTAMVPLYVALILGYGSVKWWCLFTPEQCDAINRFVSYFTLPLFAFQFTSHVDPFKMNYLFLGGDAISKIVIVIVLAFWARCSSKGSYCWSITSFSLSTLTNSLVVGVPLMKAMYGQMGVDLVVQGSVVQAIVWLTLLLFVLEFRRSGNDIVVKASNVDASVSNEQGKDLEENDDEVVERVRPSFWSLMKVVSIKLAQNPNSYACFVGIAWASVANRSVFRRFIFIIMYLGSRSNCIHISYMTFVF